jgi:hypothetical protein
VSCAAGPHVQGWVRWWCVAACCPCCSSTRPTLVGVQWRWRCLTATMSLGELRCLVTWLRTHTCPAHARHMPGTCPTQCAVQCTHAHPYMHAAIATSWAYSHIATPSHSQPPPTQTSLPPPPSVIPASPLPPLSPNPIGAQVLQAWQVARCLQCHSSILIWLPTSDRPPLDPHPNPTCH